MAARARHEQSTGRQAGTLVSQGLAQVVTAGVLRERQNPLMFSRAAAAGSRSPQADTDTMFLPCLVGKARTSE